MNGERRPESTQTEDAPDFTRRVMGRLGYMRIDPQVARRRRIKRWASRCGIFAAASVAFAVGFQFYQSGADIRRPNEATLPGALMNDLERQQNQFKTIFDSLKTRPNFEIAPSPPVRTEQFTPHGDSEDAACCPAIAPMRWV